MIRSKNSAVIIGNLVDSPQISVSNSSPNAENAERSFKIATIRVATSEEYKTQNGVQQRSEYHRVVAYRVLAEMVEKANMRKGQKVCVFGRMRSSSYIDKEGIKRISFQIEADDVFLHIREGSNYFAERDGSYQNNQEGPEVDDMEDDGIPYK
jgi:single-strand DNA-binding protein